MLHILYHIFIFIKLINFVQGQYVWESIEMSLKVAMCKDGATPSKEAGDFQNNKNDEITLFCPLSLAVTLCDAN